MNLEANLGLVDYYIEKLLVENSDYCTIVILINNRGLICIYLWR